MYTVTNTFTDHKGRILDLPHDKLVNKVMDVLHTHLKKRGDDVMYLGYKLSARAMGIVVVHPSGKAIRGCINTTELRDAISQINLLTRP